MNAEQREEYGKIGYSAAREAVTAIEPNYKHALPKWDDLQDSAREAHRTAAEAVAQAVTPKYWELVKEARIVLEILEKQPKPALGQWDWPGIADRLRKALP